MDLSHSYLTSRIDFGHSSDNNYLNKMVVEFRGALTGRIDRMRRPSLHGPP